MANRSTTGSGAVYAALEKRYPTERGAWALFSEVGNATGWKCNRHADAIAMSLWPSRGLVLEGIEIKVSRSDWLRELEAPEKADPIFEFCDAWYLAVSDEKIVQAGELPATWGLLVLDDKGKLVCKTEAPKLTPKPLDRAFVAALLRRAHESIKVRELAALERGREQGASKGPAGHEHAMKVVTGELERLRACVAEFQEASGCRIDSWDAGDIGKAVREIMAIRFNRSDGIEDMERARQYLEQSAARLAENIKTLKRKRKQVQATIAGVGDG